MHHQPCLLCCHYLTLVEGGPADHKQAGSASFLSDVVTTLPGQREGHGPAGTGHESQTGPAAGAFGG